MRGGVASLSTCLHRLVRVLRVCQVHFFFMFHHFPIFVSYSSPLLFLRVSITVQTTSNNIQAIVESRVEKRTKAEFVPAGGKRLLCFLDDLNMPAHDLFGSQPPLELLRLWIDYGFWYDRQKQTRKFVKVRKSIKEGVGAAWGARVSDRKYIKSYGL